jgi:hypothetical protein
VELYSILRVLFESSTKFGCEETDSAGDCKGGINSRGIILTIFRFNIEMQYQVKWWFIRLHRPFCDSPTRIWDCETWNRWQFKVVDTWNWSASLQFYQVGSSKFVFHTWWGNPQKLHLILLIDNKRDFLFLFTYLNRTYRPNCDLFIADERLQNSDICSKLVAFEQEVVFIVLYLLWNKTSVFPVSSERLSH